MLPTSTISTRSGSPPSHAMSVRRSSVSNAPPYPPYVLPSKSRGRVMPASASAMNEESL